MASRLTTYLISWRAIYHELVLSCMTTADPAFATDDSTSPAELYTRSPCQDNLFLTECRSREMLWLATESFEGYAPCKLEKGKPRESLPRIRHGRHKPQLRMLRTSGNA
ncbi:hypothetical protein BDV95DRAFT_581489 [Massariosphaeria phaeospora]|uniref:Uncharacterized protein n=1 Tax=Massariosphaeria phaeospora TaxID=100035 RepID=A0A7C8I2M1_9PLEO|nr:hypothetical protein BDV95DRAFT_581489 [Massariosphaeria phaeospora]